MARERLITAAGGVVWRPRPADHETRLEVLLVHRPHHADWTFPKGKPEGDEDLRVTAVREIAEETGVPVRLGHPLPATTYRTSAGPKQVSYWCARPVGPAAELSSDDEVDEVRWEEPGDALPLLTYEHDVELLEAFRATQAENRHRSRTLVALRHARAEPAGSRDDRTRRLDTRGAARADELVGLLGAYGVRSVATSPATRCRQTVEPYATAVCAGLQVDERLAEGAPPDDVRRTVAALLAQEEPTALCTHLPTMTSVLEALGLDAPTLAPGEGVVVHHHEGLVLAVEHLPVRP